MDEIQDQAGFFVYNKCRHHCPQGRCMPSLHRTNAVGGCFMESVLNPKAAVTVVRDKLL